MIGYNEWNALLFVYLMGSSLPVGNILRGYVYLMSSWCRLLRRKQVYAIHYLQLLHVSESKDMSAWLVILKIWAIACC